MHIGETKFTRLLWQNSPKKLLGVQPGGLPGVKAGTPAFKFGGFELLQIRREGKDEIDVRVAGKRACGESGMEESS
jgi:hypothetical protein